MRAFAALFAFTFACGAAEQPYSTEVVETITLCACLEVAGEPGPFAAIEEIPLPPTAAISPPIGAPRSEAIAWMRARLDELGAALDGFDRARDAARRARDVIMLSALNEKYVQMRVVHRSFAERLAEVGATPADDVVAHDLQVAAALVERAHVLLTEGRNCIAVDCGCSDWSPELPLENRAEVLLLHRPDAPDVVRAEYRIDGRIALVAGPEPASILGLVAPGVHRLDAIVERRGTPSAHTRGSFRAGPPWDLALEQRISTRDATLRRVPLRPSPSSTP